MARRSPNNSAPRDPALFDLTKKMLDSLVTAQAMNAQIEHNTDVTSLGIQKLETILKDFSGGGMSGVVLPGGVVLGGAGAGPVGYGMPGVGGRPIMPSNQSQRPTMGGYPGGGYPGGPGYGMQGSMRPGLLGYAQHMVGRALHGHVQGGGAVNFRQEEDGTFSGLDKAGNVVSQGLSRFAALRQQAMLGGAGHLVGGSGLRGALSSIPRVGLPIMGAAAVAESVYQVGHFIGNQRAANAQYQAIYGPGTSGFDQRVHNLGYRFRNTMRNAGSMFGLGTGGLSDADADKSFKAYSAMGLQGSDRNRALDFTRQNFNATGMSVDESIQVVGIGAREAASNFQTLRQSLKEVSEMAQQTGQSADVFRQKFIAGYGSAVNAGFAGSSAAIAQAQVASTVGQGRLFAGLNTANMYSSIGGQQVLAARAGYGSVLDFALAGQANPQVVAQAQQKQLNQVFESVVSPDVRALIQQVMGKHGGAQEVATNQNAAQSVVNDVEHQRPGALNAIAILSAMRAAGVAGAETLDSVAAAIYYVQWVAKGGQNFTNPTAKAMAANAQRNDSQVQQLGKTAASFGLDKKTYGLDKVNGKYVFDPVIDRMQQENISMVRVQTAQGERLVTLQQAATQYRDQLTNGTAILASGPKAGQTVGTIYGKEQNEGYSDTTQSKGGKSALSDSDMAKYKSMGLTETQINAVGALRSDGDFGKKFAPAFAKKLAEQNAKGGGGTVTVGLTDDAKKYLTISTSGDSLVNQAAAAGGPPSLNPSGSSTGR